ncbi:MAG: hypothetical protein IPL28_26220 [Chloroflexi bacterium]|nr:hypothetical protein [Chloroflexota bacterium]
MGTAKSLSKHIRYALRVLGENQGCKITPNLFALLLFCPFAINFYCKKAKKGKGKGYLGERRLNGTQLMSQNHHLKPCKIA